MIELLSTCLIIVLFQSVTEALLIWLTPGGCTGGISKADTTVYREMLDACRLSMHTERQS